jgi:hypothetical protein
MEKKLRLFKGGRKRDIYEDAKWKKRPIDMNGELMGGGSPNPAFEQFPYHYGDDNEALRSKAMDIVDQITTDPIERSIADLMLENYTEKEISKMLKISLARVEWFMRKIGGWKRKGEK